MGHRDRGTAMVAVNLQRSLLHAFSDGCGISLLLDPLVADGRLADAVCRLDAVQSIPRRPYVVGIAGAGNYFNSLLVSTTDFSASPSTIPCCGLFIAGRQLGDLHSVARPAGPNAGNGPAPR